MEAGEGLVKVLGQQLGVPKSDHFPVVIVKRDRHRCGGTEDVCNPSHTGQLVSTECDRCREWCFSCSVSGAGKGKRDCGKKKWMDEHGARRGIVMSVLRRKKCCQQNKK